MYTFSTNYAEIMALPGLIDPAAYAKSRNYTTGAVTRLSPYLSRGMMSTRQVARMVLQKGYSFYQSEKFIQELAWREYWQRVWQAKSDAIGADLKHPQAGVRFHHLAAALPKAATGITAVDEHIQHLQQTGYMHNHLRMYTASIACNLGKAHWLPGARWMYYHLLDGDPASNYLSWQWVAGSGSNKKYFCNQENINRYTGTCQTGTFLDVPYEQLPDAPIPATLQAAYQPTLTTILPDTALPVLAPLLPLLLYNSFNLDPLWRSREPANRILLLEPSHFDKYPVSRLVLNFILSLAHNIPGIQVYSGELTGLLNAYTGKDICSKEHPAFTHYPGTKDDRDWMFPEVKGYYTSFFSFWKKCERYKNQLQP